MGDKTGIEWTDATWNPVTGCTKVSPGCDHCYAEGIFNRFNGPGAFDTVQLRPERMGVPLRWRKPRRVFVNSMSDLFHEDVPDEYIAQVFAVMATAYRHTFQILTKRHGRMRSLLSSDRFVEMFDRAYCAVPDWADRWPDPDYAPGNDHLSAGPLHNVWLGVSVEDQKWADIRIPALLTTPAAVRFLSCEPLLGPINLIGPGGNLRGAGIYALPDPPEHEGGEPVCQAHGVERCNQGCAFIDWVIVGGESGPRARPMSPDWARSIRDACQDAGVAFLFKQWGEWSPGGSSQPNGTRRAIYGPLTVHEVEAGTAIRAMWTFGGGIMTRRGKHAAGRSLDGRTWDEYPTGAPSQETTLFGAAAHAH